MHEERKEKMADLTSKEKGSGVVVVIVSSLVLGGMLFLLSFLAHQYHPPVAHVAPTKPPPHGGHPPPVHPAPEAAPKAELYPVHSPGFWLLVLPTFGLAATPPLVALAIGIVLGFLYGLEAALLASYDLTNPLHIFALILDLTWCLPSTILGFVVGNIIYLIIGSPSRDQSRGKTWISFSGSFSGSSGAVLQTLGTVNLGGAGAHELVHLMQARIFGPVYLPLQLVSYVLNSLIQLLFTCTLGWILLVAKVRDSAWFRPASDSAVRTPSGQKSGAADFFGWIYRYSLMELWAYATQ
jgi:hypothetical protein